MSKSNPQSKSLSRHHFPPQIDFDEDSRSSSRSPTVQLDSPGDEEHPVKRESTTAEDTLSTTTTTNKPSLDTWVSSSLPEDNNNDNNRRYSFPYEPISSTGWSTQLGASQWYDTLSITPGTAASQMNQLPQETIYPSPALSQSQSQSPGLSCQGIQSAVAVSSLSPHHQTIYSPPLPQYPSSSTSSTCSVSAGTPHDHSAEYSYDYFKNFSPWQIVPLDQVSTSPGLGIYSYSMYPPVELNGNMSMSTNMNSEKELDRTGALGVALPGTGIY